MLEYKTSSESLKLHEFSHPRPTKYCGIFQNLLPSALSASFQPLVKRSISQWSSFNSAYGRRCPLITSLCGKMDGWQLSVGQGRGARSRAISVVMTHDACAFLIPHILGLFRPLGGGRNRGAQSGACQSLTLLDPHAHFRTERRRSSQLQIKSPSCHQPTQPSNLPAAISAILPIPDIPTQPYSHSTHRHHHHHHARVQASCT